MTEQVRLLNDKGQQLFEQFIQERRSEPAKPAPVHLLYDSQTSVSAPFLADIKAATERPPFGSSYELGQYLNQVLGGIDKQQLSHSYQLWNWLALFLFDELCPTETAVLETAAYVLQNTFNYRRYYRHLVRSAWLGVAVHGEYSRVLLTAIGAKNKTPVAVRNEVTMQLSATQAFVESQSIVQLAYQLYYDPKKGRHKVGAGGDQDGSPRRLTAVLNQFDLTYDLGSAPVLALLGLLPREFRTFQPKTLKAAVTS